MTWEIQYRVDPSFEAGYAICVREIPRRRKNEYRLWAYVGPSSELPSWRDLESLTYQSVDAATALSLLAVIEGVAVPAVPPFALGLDGVTHTLSVTKGLNTVTVKWWGQLPEDWGSLSPALARLEELALENARG
jgi:hypothetical protein